MNIIHEYTLRVAEEQTVELPAPYEILDIQTLPTAPDTPVMWVMHPHPAERVHSQPVTIHMRGTGHSLQEELGARHISTIQIRGGEYVLHTFWGR